MRRGEGRGREESHREYSPRIEERERRSGWGVAPPSRRLWVGNLSSHVTQNLLSEQFLRFGDLEEIAYVPGRSYAFVNFIKEEDAIIAFKGLQGFSIAGAPIRIEFAKGDRDSVLSNDEEYSSYNEGRRSIERGGSLSRRGLRPRRASPERSHDKSKEDKSSDPSEMLWIGFPPSLHVDEVILRRAFTPFGEIEKITSFPGRSYAFVRYRTIVAACRAKEALQGKLFNNPRVRICFAKNDGAQAEQGRAPMDDNFAPHFGSNSHPGTSVGLEPFRRERNFDSPVGEFRMSSPQFIPQIDRMSGDSSVMGFGRNTSVRIGSGPGPNFGGKFDHFRLQDVGSERNLSEDEYERHRINPAADRPAPWHDLPFERPLRVPLFEDPWSEEDGSFPLAKKIKTDTFPDKELPEYPFSNINREQHDIGATKLFPSFSQFHTYEKNFELAPSVYKGVSDHSRNLSRPCSESEDPWRTSDGPGTLPPNLGKFQITNPGHHQPNKLNEEWKWEGMIAKGGTPVCRARCFPVGKVLDFMLPEFLNCTARTGLDMLAKHYYQAASTWVVFFVPGTDADIVLYNEFMHYLGEKQRAAVAKLNENATLFLVPPSDFSEQVLKVPGKVSISGVILKFQQPSSNFSSLHHPLESTESQLPSLGHGPSEGVKFHEDVSFHTEPRSFSQGQNYFSSSSGLVAPVISTFPPTHKPDPNLVYSGSLHPKEKVSDFHGHDEVQHQKQSNWAGHMHVLGSNNQSLPPSVPNTISHSFDSSRLEEYPLANSRVTQGMVSNSYTPESLPQQQESKPQLSSSMPIPLQPEQLAQLAVLLRQQKQSGKGTLPSTDGTFNQVQQLQHHPPTVSGARIQAQQHPSSASEYHQISQMQQLHQQQSNISTVHPGQQNNQQAPSSSREETEADPQKRLQATLQLAAALLQQIQQQSKAATD